MRLYSAGPDAVRLLSCMLARYPARDLASPEPAPAPADAAALARLTVPVLVINGEFETISRRRAADALVRALPEAEHVILQGAGHLPNLDDPDASEGYEGYQGYQGYEGYGSRHGHPAEAGGYAVSRHWN